MVDSDRSPVTLRMVKFWAFRSKIRSDFPKLLERFGVFNDFLGENIGIGKIVGFFEAFVSEPKDVKVGYRG